MTSEVVGSSDDPSRSARLTARVDLFRLALALGVTLAALVLLAPSTTGIGPAMDEGAVLAYSARVLDGAVPHRDFVTFYGPGNLWLVAGAFELFGTSVTTERAVGLLYRILIVLALFALARRLAGDVAGILAGLVAASIMAGDLIWAYSTYGAIAFGLVGLALAASGAASPPGGRQRLLLLGSGVAAGVAVLVRFDVAPAVLVSMIPLLLITAPRSRLWYGVGFLGLAGLYGPHLLVVGPSKAERVLSDLAATEPGRTLPLPRPWEHPGSLLAATVLVMALLVVSGAALSRRGRPPDLTGRLLLAAGLFSLGLLPAVLSRADVFHVKPFAIVPLSLLPALALLVARSSRVRPPVRVATFVAVVAVVAAVVLGRADLSRVDEPTVENAGRSFDAYEDRAQSVTAVLAHLERASRAGDTLFVGPQDLRRTNYGPTYIYFLLPNLEPASYYMEMNPQTANREGSGLADELRAADWLVLTSEWDGWNEPNDSALFGPAEPNEVVRDRFCQRLESGFYRLYERCDRGGAA